MKIAVDAMGGDHAPQNIVAGAIEALRDNGAMTRLFFVGDRPRVEAELQRRGVQDGRIEIVHTTEVIEMEDSPVQAVRRKKDSSMSRAIDLVKRGEADAVVSAGNTGALMTAAHLKLRTLEGIDRPALAVRLPAPKHAFILIDAGANLEPHASNLVQYGIMGSQYAQRILNYRNPRVAVFSIGTEEMKANASSLKWNR